MDREVWQRQYDALLLALLTKHHRYLAWPESDEERESQMQREFILALNALTVFVQGCPYPKETE